MGAYIEALGQLVWAQRGDRCSLARSPSAEPIALSLNHLGLDRQVTAIITVQIRETTPNVGRRSRRIALTHGSTRCLPHMNELNLGHSADVSI